MTTDLNRGPIGGSASTGGATYGATVTAWACVRMLLGARATLAWRLPHLAFIRSMVCENASEVDDLVLHVMPQARVYIQIKHGLDAGAEFKSAIGQMSRQFAQGNFNRNADRLVIVTDSSASGTIRVDLPKALSWFHDLPHSTPLTEFPHGAGPADALERVKKVFDTEYTDKCCAPTEKDWREFLTCVELTVLDPMDGNERQTSIESLHQVVGSKSANLAWIALTNFCLDAGRSRRPFDVATVEAALRIAGVTPPQTSGGWTSSIASALQAVSRFQLDLLKVRCQYVRSLYVNRSVLDKPLQDLGTNEKKILLITSGSGQGKTMWCAFHCEIDDGEMRIFIPAEAILETDQHLRGTLTRMLKSSAEDYHQVPFAPAEIKSWLESAALTVFVDGLDRTAMSRQLLKKWLHTTAFECKSFAGCVVMTARPEILDLVLDALADDVKLAGLGDFSETEAIEVALKIGIPSLARYRHPRLMSFCAQLARTEDISSLRREQTVSRFIDKFARQLAGDFETFPEIIESALDDLGKLLALSQNGHIGESERASFEGRHTAAYQALRKTHFLSVFGRSARLEIDDVAEHLAGRHIVIDADLSCWEQISQSPLRVGALRSALEQLASRDPAKARGYLNMLAKDLVAPCDLTKLTLYCSVILANEELDPLFALAIGAAVSWDRDSIELGWGAGLTLLDMLSSDRWPAIRRVELLWKLAHLEDGQSWRHKEWRAYDATAPIIWNEWRGRFLKSVREAGVPGLQFLLQWFDSRDELADSQEAHLGDLAQGAFFAIAHCQLRDAIDLLATAQNEGMLQILARHYPAQVLEILRDWVGALALPQATVVVEATLRAENGNDAAHSLSAAWLERTAVGSDERRRLLRVLTYFGDPTASAELVQFPSLTATDVATLARLPVDAFAHAISVVVKRADVTGGMLQGLYPPPDLVEPCARILLAVWSASHPPDIGLIVENLCRVAEKMSSVPAPVYGLVDLVLRKGSAADRRILAYFAVPWNRERRPTDLVFHVLNEMCNKETDVDNLHHMASRLKSSTLSNAEIASYLARLGV